MKRVIYVAGPMSGIAGDNKPEFHKYADFLGSAGYTVLNPAILPASLTQAQYMDICLAMVRSADCICILPGWENSAGAKAEIAYATKLGMDIFTVCETLGGSISIENDATHKVVETTTASSPSAHYVHSLRDTNHD